MAASPVAALIRLTGKMCARYNTPEPIHKMGRGIEEVNYVEDCIDRKHPVPQLQAEEDVKIVWHGGRIAKLIFASGKVVDFSTSITIETVQDKQIS